MLVHVAQFTGATIDSVTTKKDKLRKEWNNLLVKYGDLERYNMQLQKKVALLEDMLQILQPRQPNQNVVQSPTTSQEFVPPQFTVEVSSSWVIVPYNMGSVPISIVEPDTYKGPQVEGDIDREELLRSLSEYKEKCDNHDEETFKSNMKIVTKMLEHLNRRVNNKLNSINYRYSSMVDAIKKFDNDKERAIPLMEIWIPRNKDLVLMGIGVKQDPNPPEKFKPTIFLISKIEGYMGNIEPFEKKIKELVKSFHESHHGLLPSILRDDDSIKNLQEWKNETNKVISDQAMSICQKFDMETLKINMDMLVHVETILLEFNKEANKIVSKYAPYKQRANEVMNFDWPTEDEFLAWKGRYLEGVRV